MFHFVCQDSDDNSGIGLFGLILLILTIILSFMPKPIVKAFIKWRRRISSLRSLSRMKQRVVQPI
ncbi:MAG: hypothetical protein ACD_58C00092G0009 [uncultured bacterium]|nr:MAG: hypothetical protein ACD_58C00092G0009 [uncultured bacterium]